ncbi:proteasome maturation protein-like [Amphiura filiformis]|uniref:proteasome maturation protein-like n=1 Tax=Amphiura filiformis TaxID=82378 RepID=UPI003B20E77A
MFLTVLRMCILRMDKMASSGNQTFPMAQTEVPHQRSNYGAPNLMAEGPTSVKDGLVSSHPLERSEKSFLENKHAQEMAFLQRTQGRHAPLRLRMEQHAVKQIGRAPCLPSSNVAMDSLLGRDLEIGFEDILNAPGDSEMMGNPHAMMERQQGLI